MALTESVKMKLLDRFLVKYNSLSLEQKDDLIIDYKGQLLSWPPIFHEVVGETDLGWEMLEQMFEDGKI